MRRRRRTLEERCPHRKRSRSRWVVQEARKLLFDVWPLEDEDNLRPTEVDTVANEPDVARVVGRTGSQDFSCGSVAVGLQLRNHDNPLHLEIVSDSRSAHVGRGVRDASDALRAHPGVYAAWVAGKRPGAEVARQESIQTLWPSADS